jgi:hypothetical protein
MLERDYLLVKAKMDEYERAARQYRLVRDAKLALLEQRTLPPASTAVVLLYKTLRNTGQWLLNTSQRLEDRFELS